MQIEQDVKCFGLSAKILFSVSIQQPVKREIEAIPLSFPVQLPERRVVLQTFAGLYDSSTESKPFIMVYTRDSLLKNKGQYFVWDSDGGTDCGKGFVNSTNLDFRSLLPLLKGRAGDNFVLKKLFLIESMSQYEFGPNNFLLNEVVLTVGCSAVKGDELVQFEQDVRVDSAIMDIFIDALKSFLPDHPRRQNNIILLNEFYWAVQKKATETDEQHRLQVKHYLDEHIRSLELSADTILHIPVNFDHIHFFYCAVVFSKETMYFCDSVSERFEELKIDTSVAYLTICQALNWELEYRQRATIDWKPCVTCEFVMQQKEKPLVRCGVYCMIFLLRGLLEGIFCDRPFEKYNLTKATFTTQFFKLLKKRIVCFLTREISLYQLLELFVDFPDLSNQRRLAKEELLRSSHVVTKTNKSYDFVCKKGWLPDDLYPSFLID
jgi:hypothetical protein